MIRVFYEAISDFNVREAVKSLVDSLNQLVWIKGRWQFVEINLEAAATDEPIAHSLGFVPVDIILLHNSTGTDVSWNYDLFTSERIYLTTTGASRLRFFVGQYQEG